jgi:hypothetical protein
MKFSHIVARGSLIIAAASLVAPLTYSVANAAKPSGGTPPASPVVSSLASGNRSLTVTWSDSSSGTITFVATARSAGKTTKSCTSHATSCSISSLVNGVIYNVSVVATNSGGSSAPSAVMTQIVGIPGPPLSVHTLAATASAVISWGPPKASGVAAVTSYMATVSPGGFSCSSQGTLLNAPARTCQIPGLNSGTKYFVTVTATNAYGTGVPSKEGTVTPN